MKAFRQIIPNPEHRYEIHEAIHNAFASIENPRETAKSVPNRPNHFTIEVQGYLVPFEIIEENRLLLLPIRKLSPAL